MATVGMLLLLILAVGTGVWWLRWSGATEGLGDRLREVTANLYPHQPIPRRMLPRRLLRSAEGTVTIGVSGTALVPSRIEIKVHPDDLGSFAEATEWLSKDIAEELRKRASAKGWTVPAGPQVLITADPERPVRVPHATGYIGALSPQDVRTLQRYSPPQAAPQQAHQPGNDFPGPAADPAPVVSRPDPQPTRQATEALGETRPASWGELAGTADATEPTRAAPVLHFRLVATAGEEGADLNAILSSPSARLVLGRSRQADLRTKDQGVSGHHCVFALDPQQGALVVEDLGSTNGTYVAGRAGSPTTLGRGEKAVLNHGDTLKTGGLSWQVHLNQIPQTRT